MTVIAFRAFGGEIPRQQDAALPENAAQDALNCDLAHGELRGMRGDALRNQPVRGTELHAVYTEDGIKFFGWPYPCYPVRSMVVDDIHNRIYYTAALSDGPIAKVARTRELKADGTYREVIGGSVPPFEPPEYTTPGYPGGNSVGPDSWLLGVPAPKVQAGYPQENLAVTLIDREEWPAIPKMQLRVTLFYEDVAGNIVYQQDISNYDTSEGAPFGYFNVFYNPSANANPTARGNRVQDMMWQLGTKHAPYKYYYFDPTGIDLAAVQAPVTTVNPGTAAATFNFVSSSPAGPVVVA